MTRIFTVSLTGRQEVPPNNSPAGGGGTVIWDEAASKAAYQFTVRDLDFGPATGTGAQTPSTSDDVTSMHFHSQFRGATGGVVFGQINPAQDADDLRITPNADGSWTVTGAWERTDPATVPITDFAAVLNLTPAGLDIPLYFNVHSTAFPAGEIRGQLVSAGTVGSSIQSGFDAEFYKQTYPDVAVAAVFGINPRLHFDSIGWKEGRDPNALFDTSGYLETYRDVAAVGVNPLDHYMTFGAGEGRDPSRYFDSSAYLAAYPDVAAAGVNPLQHFLAFGIREGRSGFADDVWG
jgi:CHRD domain